MGQYIHLSLDKEFIPTWEEFLKGLDNRPYSPTLRELITGYVLGHREAAKTVRLERWSQENTSGFGCVLEVWGQKELAKLTLNELEILQNKTVARYQEVSGALKRKSEEHGDEE